MIGTLVVTLGQLGEAFLEATEHIIGRPKYVSHFSVGWNEACDETKARLKTRIEEVDTGSGVLLLTDMFGSTAFNLSNELAVPGQVEVLTGVNLPMIIKASTMDRRVSLKEAANMLRNQGKRSISIVGELL